jgi:hypothetical protein
VPVGVGAVNEAEGVPRLPVPPAGPALLPGLELSPGPGPGRRAGNPPGSGVAESHAMVTVTVLPAGTGPFGVTETTVPVGTPLSSAQAIWGVSPCSRSQLLTVAYCWSWKAGTVM